MFNPVKYDPETAPVDDEGLFYDGYEILSVHQYMDDDECDYDAGYISILVAYYKPECDQYGDANYFGYKSVAKYMEDEYHTDDVWRIAESGYDVGDFNDLVKEVRECEGIDLLESMRIVDELLA